MSYRSLWGALGATLRGWLAQDYSRLEIAALDRSWPLYAHSAGTSLAHAHDLARYDALDAFLSELERWGLTPDVVNVKPVGVDADRVVSLLRATGPIRIKQLIAGGVNPDDAYEMAFRRTVNAGSSYLHDVYAAQSLEAMEAEPQSTYLQGYRRRAQPGACPFCRVLEGAASKHIVYNVSDTWAKPHDNCRCELVPQSVYRIVRQRSPEEIAAGKAMHAYIKAAKDAAKVRRQRLYELAA